MGRGRVRIRVRARVRVRVRVLVQEERAYRGGVGRYREMEAERDQRALGGLEIWGDIGRYREV